MLTVVQAFDRQPFAELPTDDAVALERKLGVAFRLSRDHSAWLKPHQRIDILHRLAMLMEGKREHFARQISREGGKPYTDAMVETSRAIDGVRSAAEILRTRGGRECRRFTYRLPQLHRFSKRRLAPSLEAGAGSALRAGARRRRAGDTVLDTSRFVAPRVRSPQGELF